MFLKDLARRAEYESLRTIARLVAEGEFERRGVRPAAGVADLLGMAPRDARRLVAAAEDVFPTSPTGAALEPLLPATATALGGFEIDRAHVEVIGTVLSSGGARRLDPELRGPVEAQLADWAWLYRPDELAVLARAWIDRLDQDGPPPDDESPPVNELFLCATPGGGGRIRGRFDAPTYEAVARAVRAASAPDPGPDTAGAALGRPAQHEFGRRQAEALAAICEHALDDGYLPAEGGQRPHVTAVLDFDRLVD